MATNDATPREADRAEAAGRITLVAEAIGKALGASTGPDGYRVYVDWDTLVDAARAALAAVPTVQAAAGDADSSGQWNPLLRVLVNEFGGLVSGESAAETTIRILRESAGDADRAVSEPDAERVEAAAKAMCEVDKKSLRHTSDSEYDTDAEWGEVLDKSTFIANEGWSLGRDHYRDLARAALAAVPEPDADMTLAYMKGWQDGQDAMRKSVDAAADRAVPDPDADAEMSCPNCRGTGQYDDCTCNVCEGDGNVLESTWRELAGGAEPDADAVEMAAERLYQHDLDEHSPKPHYVQVPWKRQHLVVKDRYRMKVEAIAPVIQAAVPTVQAAAGDDLDAMLDSVHPRAIVRSVWALRGGGWEACISVPEGPDDDGWYDYTGNQSVGTGPTRIAALQNAVDKANR